MTAPGDWGEVRYLKGEELSTARAPTKHDHVTPASAHWQELPSTSSENESGAGNVTKLGGE